MSTEERCVMCGEIIPEGSQVCLSCRYEVQSKGGSSGVMCGIDQAIQYLRENCSGFEWTDLVINRLEYHRKQAEGLVPRYHKGMSIKSYYTCRNCGRTADIIFNFCPNCGYALNWDNPRCLTGLPLVDAAAKAKEKDDERKNNLGLSPGENRE